METRLIVDSHCHASPVWFEPVETLLFQMDRYGVDVAVLVQLLGQYDNAYQQTCAAEWPDRFISVVSVDPERRDAEDALRALAAGGARGVRLRPGTRSSGEDPLRLWRVTAECGLVVSCVGTTAQFSAPAFAELTGAFPDLPIVLEHLGGVARPDAEPAHEAIWALARFPNIFLKAPGLGQLGRRSPSLPASGDPFEPGAAAALVQAIEAFSPARMMWGSDFPPVASREGYGRALAGPRSALASLSEMERAQLFGGTAARLFRIGERPS